LACGGKSRFHTASVASSAALIRFAAGLAGRRILNVADPRALPVNAIAADIASDCGYSDRLVAIPDVDVILLRSAARHGRSSILSSST
jgi:hypothetical protein